LTLSPEPRIFVLAVMPARRLGRRDQDER
jgi:hypothetical protein